MTNYLNLMSYTLTSATDEPHEEADEAWMNVFADVMGQIEHTYHTILSTLTLVSTSLLSGQPLPPYIPLPRPFELTRHLLNLSGEHRRTPDTPASSGSSTVSGDDTEPEDAPQKVTLGPDAWNLLDARNMGEKGYTEFAVLQVCSTLVIGDLEGMVKTVSELLGTVNFDFRVDDRPKDSSSDSDRLENVISRQPSFHPALRRRATKG